MKKKLALFMAAVMATSLIPTAAFAGSAKTNALMPNLVSGKTNTLFVEPTTDGLTQVIGTVSGDSNVSNVNYGNNLVIDAFTAVPGSFVNLTLTNGVFYFKGSNYSDLGKYALNAGAANSVAYATSTGALMLTGKNAVTSTTVIGGSTGNGSAIDILGLGDINGNPRKVSGAVYGPQSTYTSYVPYFGTLPGGGVTNATGDSNAYMTVNSSTGIPNAVPTGIYSSNDNSLKLPATYDTKLGFFVQTGVSTSNGKTIPLGTYYRYFRFGSNFTYNSGINKDTTYTVTGAENQNTDMEVPYKLTVNSPTQATLVYLDAMFPSSKDSATYGPTKGMPYGSMYNFKNSGAVDFSGFTQPSYNGGAVVNVPLPIIATNSSNVTLSYTGNVVGAVASMTVAQPNSGATTAAFSSLKTGVNNIALDTLTINETAASTIDHGIFKLTAPSGFNWIADTSGVQIGTTLPLAWGSGNGGSGTSGIGKAGTAANGTTPAQGDYVIQIDSNNNGIMYVQLNNMNLSQQLPGALTISGLQLQSINDNGNTNGSTNLNVQISDNSGYTGNGFGGTGFKNANTNIVSQSIPAATLVNYSMSLTASGTVPTLLAGRYTGFVPNDNPSSTGNIDDTDHKTARVEFKELAVGSWWASRTTTFTLPTGVEFRKVQFVSPGSSNLNDAVSIGGTSPTSANLGGGITFTTSPINANSNNVYVNVPGNLRQPAGSDGTNNATVTYNSGNSFSLSSMGAPTAGQMLDLYFDAWVSISPDFNKDVTLTVSGTAVSNTIAPVTIAKTQAPITVTTTPTNVKVGYQYQASADIKITENVAGAFVYNDYMYVTITDGITGNLALSPNTKVDVTAGDLTLTDVQFNSSINTYAFGNGGDSGSLAQGALQATINRSSSVASTISLTNVQVISSTVVPNTGNRNYNVVVWGPSIAANFRGLYTSNNGNNSGGTSHNGIKMRLSGSINNGGGYTNGYSSTVTDMVTDQDLFNVPGFQAPYINMTATTNDFNNQITNASGTSTAATVKIVIGQSQYTVNGTSKTADAPAYIDSDSNTTMVPVRVIANSFGIADTNIVWDPSQGIVTILGSKTIQMQTGNNVMTVDGAKITMFSPDNLPVQAQVRNSRLFVPLRAIGQAFGVQVQWDAASNTVTLNPQAATATAAPAASAKPAASATAAPVASASPTATAATK